MMLTRVGVIASSVAGLCSAPAFGQGFGFGAKAGVNITTQRLEGPERSPSLDPRLGAVAGVFATVPLPWGLDLQPEAVYAMKGARLDLGGNRSSAWIDYLEVPVLARFSRRRGGSLDYFVAGGPSIGFRVRARTRTTFGGSTEEIDISDDVERLDFGVAVGGGVELGSIVLEGRYTLGLKDIDKDKTDAVTVTNRALSVTLGFRF